jgi:hypothetical protein
MEFDNEDSEPRMDARIATVLSRLLSVADDLRYAVREERFDSFLAEYVREDTDGAFLVIPVHELVRYRYRSAPPAVPAPVTAGELSEMLRRIVSDCRGVRGLHSPAAPQPRLLMEAAALLQRIPKEED